jgi:hypothetical protein
MNHLDEQGKVGADVNLWPRWPMANLDEQGKVGADVHPWPRSPMANLDVQRDAMQIDRAVGTAWGRARIKLNYPAIPSCSPMLLQKVRDHS